MSTQASTTAERRRSWLPWYGRIGVGFLIIFVLGLLAGGASEAGTYALAIGLVLVVAGQVSNIVHDARRRTE